MTYHYRFVATNPDGTAAGPDATFNTEAYANPIKAPASPVIIHVDPPVVCKKGSVEEFGKCVKVLPTCKKGQVAKNGRCVPAPCPKGKVRKHGKCVKKKASHKKKKG
jgi:hypothetical protein